MANTKKYAKQKISLQNLPSRRTIPFNFGDKHIEYIRKCRHCTFNILEGAVRSGKTVDNIFAFAHELKTTPDRIHLATGSTMGNAKLNIGDANGFGLEWIFRGQCRWTRYHNLDALVIKGPLTNFKTKVVIFAGAGNQYAYQKIRGNSYGMWIATEINLHHDNVIKEAFNRQLAAVNRKVFWDLNPSHPNAPIYSEYIDKYRKLDAEGTLLGGCNYEHMTIFDNINISQQRLNEIVSQYDPGSVWYVRDILGKRSVAQGLIYAKFASITQSGDNYLLMSKETVWHLRDHGMLLKITIGVDFGGNGSGHAFCATATTLGYDKLIILRSELHKDTDIDPEKLGNLFVAFVKKVLIEYRAVTNIWCDNAEPVLIRGLKKSLIQAGLGNINIGNAKKVRINNRVYTATTLCAMNRLYYTTDAETVADAMRTAVWDSKKIVLTRLDDGTSDIDSLDAFEYSYERDIRYLVDKLPEGDDE